ncbi:MAG: ECF transporter S component [Caldisericia bacterium]|nr:ECF transporter S component [Caldisericia bacterium]
MRETLRTIFKRPFTPIGISLVGIMSGMALTVTRLLTFYPIPSLRFDPGGPAIIMIAGMILGPIGGALVGGLSDVIGFFFWNPTGLPWNPLIFTAQVMYGFVAGLIMMKRWDSSKTTRLIQIIVAVVVAKTVGFMFVTWGLTGLLHIPFMALFTTRIIVQPFFIIWYSVICFSVVQSVETLIPWRKRFESNTQKS